MQKRATKLWQQRSESGNEVNIGGSKSMNHGEGEFEESERNFWAPDAYFRECLHCKAGVRSGSGS
jgi:hypothetical protein